MRFDLTSGTDAGLHALFDPGAVEPLPGDPPMREWEAWVRRLEHSGACLTYDEGGDGDVKLKLVVDEDFDDPGQTRTELLSGALLRVPTGRLFFAGIEYLFWDGHPRPNLKAAGREVRVPAGNYELQGLEVDWERLGGDAERERDAMLEPGDRRYARRFNGCVAPLGVVTVMASIVTSFLVLVLSGRPWAWRLTWLAVAGGAAAAAVGVLWRMSGSPRMKRWEDADKAMWERYPRLVVILRRLPDGTAVDGFTPARMTPQWPEDPSHGS